MSSRVLPAVLLTILGLAALPATAADRTSILKDYAAAAKAADPAFAGFSAPRGETLFRSKHVGGKPDTPMCTTCHGDDPRKEGKTRAGKVIEPLAGSVTAARYTDPEKIEKWFKRNCDGVMGRECTALEKGDFITFMIGQ
ncbi:MAG: DUF1924 domain-containing protein [Alphaproteobacteria bacterium]